MSAATTWRGRFGLSGPGARLRRVNWCHPEWWAAGAAVIAWLALLTAAGSDIAVHGLSGHSHALGATSGRSGLAVLTAWAVMAVAMMVPLTLPTVRHVALSSFWSRRHRAAAAFLAGYLCVWLTAGAVLVAAVTAFASLAGETFTVMASFTAATAWQLSPRRQRALRRCARTVPLAPRGWHADRDCALFGVSVGRTCVTTCWALMVATVAAAHTLEIMGAFFALQLHERSVRRPNPLLGAVLVTATGLVLVMPGLFTS